MKLCCGHCHVELKDQDKVVLDDFGIIRHKNCYDYANGLHLIDTVGICKDVRGHIPRFLLDTYKDIIAMDPDEFREAEEIMDAEVIETLSYTLGHFS